MVLNGFSYGPKQNLVDPSHPKTAKNQPKLSSANSLTPLLKDLLETTHVPNLRESGNRDPWFAVDRVDMSRYRSPTGPWYGDHFGDQFLVFTLKKTIWNKYQSWWRLVYLTPMVEILYKHVLLDIKHYELWALPTAWVGALDEKNIQTQSIGCRQKKLECASHLVAGLWPICHTHTYNIYIYL